MTGGPLGAATLGTAPPGAGGVAPPEPPPPGEGEGDPLPPAGGTTGTSGPPGRGTMTMPTDEEFVEVVVVDDWLDVLDSVGSDDAVGSDDGATVDPGEDSVDSEDEEEGPDEDEGPAEDDGPAEGAVDPPVVCGENPLSSSVEVAAPEEPGLPVEPDPCP
ncbi:hypothetical protein [Gordonia paraffinivorans]|uniref:hypothetical protein n=1 Tax=Gordonia paraffinivorans TaxID=175628 RepID=UPI001446B408|nr:hypothetical protein [Gordonia paraffinivorans]